jgi:hypothetical protein
MTWPSSADALADRGETVRSRRVPGHVIGAPPCHSSFENLARTYRRFGGLQTGQAFSRQMWQRNGGSTCASLAERLATGQMFGWTWQGDFWVPMFQVDRDSLAVRPGPRRVLAELKGVFDGWSLAQWFVHPSVWLRGRRPLEVLATRPAAVVLAARGDRVIAGA